MKSWAPSTYCFEFWNSGNSAPCFCQCPNAFSAEDLLAVCDQIGVLVRATLEPNGIPAAPSAALIPKADATT